MVTGLGLEESTAFDSAGGAKGSSMLRGSPSMYKLVLVSSLGSPTDLKESPFVPGDDGNRERLGTRRWEGSIAGACHEWGESPKAQCSWG